MRVVYRLAFVSVLGSVLVGAAAMDSKLASGETFVTASELAAKVKGTTSDLAYQVPNSTGTQVLMIRRDKTGDAEVHTTLNDTIIVERGTGKFRVGGTISGNHEIRPTEWRGGEMTGWREYSLSPGDLLVIPAGVPHQAIVTSGTLLYLAIKTPHQPAP
jgi:mannose-6-phosphate isomerase-like protein (cupin superfamily)